MKKKMCAGCRKENCDGCQWNLRKKLHTNKEELLAEQPEHIDKKAAGYGLVFDVGTTTVAGYLWDLQTGKCLCAQSCPNPQRALGSDVISRISYCMAADGAYEEARQKKMQQMIVQALDKLAGDLLVSAEVEESVARVIVVGNTVMCSILAGKPVKELARAPFKKPYANSIRWKGHELCLTGLSQSEVIILPAIESYLGADALAVYRYVKKNDDRNHILIVDIGTNGEIILVGKEAVYACSTAAGPALEGAAVTQGMCATEGAIEAVSLVGNFPREDIYCKVIGNGKPEGICGSGLVDVLALCLEIGIIDASGYLRSCEEARRAGVRERICQRIEQKNGERKILLTTKEAPVYLTAEDIRQLQLAKGAVWAAVQLLLEKEGITTKGISRIYLAGAFGSYINPENAMKIGLLPKVEKEKIISLGNGAALGGALALFSENEIAEMQQSAGRIKHVELAKEPMFEEYFMKGISMP